jgi:thermostable 8-oxoguanine DNA glycosylase
MNKILKDSVSRAFDTMNDKAYVAYLEHFKAIQPKDSKDIFERFLFSYLSVQTPWQKNILLYKELKDYNWANGEDPVRDLFIREGIGFQNTRPRFITTFVRDYKADPELYIKKDDESWPMYRARLDKKVCGLAKAKLSFVAEMCYPEDSELVCFDRHMLREVFRIKKRKYGIDCTITKYRKYEQMWIREARARGMAPAVARLLYWDQLQGYESSLFWTEVFI